MTRVRWVQFIAGAVVLISVFLSIWVNRWWLLLTTLAGADLTQAALTQWCLLDKILKELGVKE